MTDQPTAETPSPSDDRWTFIRDVLVLQVKLLLSNVQNLVMVPVTIFAALFDLVSKRGAREGEQFYKMLDLAREIDEGINLYGAIGGYHATGPSSPLPDGSGAKVGGVWRGTSVDGVVRQVEDVIVREYQKGGTAASVKAAVDRVLDELQKKESKK